jgi:hypothetical protein
MNVIDSFGLDDEGGGFGEVFRYDFDSPDTTGQLGGSLGNDIETIIAPGDSGGSALLQGVSGWDVMGINTFTEGYDGRFGDTGRGVLVAPYRDWIVQTTGIPEPSTAFLIFTGWAAVILIGHRKQSRSNRVAGVDATSNAPDGPCCLHRHKSADESAQSKAGCAREKARWPQTFRAKRFGVRRLVAAFVMDEDRVYRDIGRQGVINPLPPKPPHVIKNPHFSKNAHCTRRHGR